MAVKSLLPLTNGNKNFQKRQKIRQICFLKFLLPLTNGNKDFIAIDKGTIHKLRRQLGGREGQPKTYFCLRGGDGGF